LIQNSKFKIQNSRKGFTLIEIMVAIAIVAILAAAVLVSLKSFGAKGRSAKALAQISSVIPSMVSCWRNGGNVNSPSVGGSIDGETLTNSTEICEGRLSYGYWPQTTGNLDKYKYRTDMFEDGQSASKFHVVLFNYDDDSIICCNSVMGYCKFLHYSETNPCPSPPPSEPNWIFCNERCPSS
jgi:prepilin-type N-terminal cleavage/methylation domain-containing protein